MSNLILVFILSLVCTAITYLVGSLIQDFEIWELNNKIKEFETQMEKKQ